MNGLPLARDILSRPAQLILLATFAISLVMAARKGEGLAGAFERYAVGFLTILFYPTLLPGLFSLGQQLDSFLAQLGERDGLLNFITQSLFQSATKFGPGLDKSLPNLGTYLFQIFRSGVWGVVSSLTELVFLLARFILEVSRDALWQILYLFFPLGAGFFPIFPRALLNMSLLALELVLWIPVLTIVNVATSLLARQYSTVTFDPGFYVLACELVAILLTLSIPSFVHKLVGGSLAGDALNSWAKTLALVSIIATKGAAAKAQGIKAVRGGMQMARRSGKASVIVLGALSFSVKASAAENVNLPFGYVTKLTCKGRLLISAIGDERLLDLSALPKEIGCGVLLRPRANSGRTNLILETSGGTIHRLLTISKQSGKTEIELEK